MILTNSSQRLALDRTKESILFNILYLIGCITWPTIPRKRGRPCIFSDSDSKMFYRKDWFRLDFKKGLCKVKLLSLCYNSRQIG